MKTMKHNMMVLTSVSFLVLIMGSSSSKANVIYTDIPDVTISSGQSADFDIDGDGINDVRVSIGPAFFNATPLGAAALDYGFGTCTVPTNYATFFPTTSVGPTSVAPPPGLAGQVGRSGRGTM